MQSATGRFALSLASGRTLHKVLFVSPHMDAPIAPAICVCPGDSFVVETDDPTAIRNTPRGLTKEYYRRLIIFDTAGRAWKVDRVQPERNATIADRLLGRKLQARLICRTAPEIKMPQIVETLCSLVDDDPDDLYDQFVTHDELKEMLRGAKSPTELVSVARHLGGAG
jgi:hypothetical protein